MASAGKHAAERVSPHAGIVYEAIRREGADELKRPTSALFWSGTAAGLSIGFSFLGEAMLRAALPDAPWRPLVTKLGYSIGFIIVILGRQQLFTENTLTPILPLLTRWNFATARQVLRLWVAVLLANMIGAFIFAALLAWPPVVSPEVYAASGQIAREMLAPSIGEHFIRAIFAGWLIALVVWLLPFAETARVFVIIIVTYVIGIGHFDHVIAGSVTLFFAIANGASGAELLHWWLPVLVGNVIGGVLLVAALNHAQVVAGGGTDG
jgi:formate/nitrite transporter FocA (FNT family)